MNDWNDAVNAAGIALRHDQETIMKMSTRIAQLEAQLAVAEMRAATLAKRLEATLCLECEKNMLECTCDE